MNPSRNPAQNRRTLNAARRLIRKHNQQITAQEQHPDLANAFAITFLPERPASTFHGKTLQRVGMAPMVVMSYEPNPDMTGQFSMPLRGFRGKAHPDGSVCYGGDAGNLFLYDGAICPKHGAAKGAIVAVKNPMLVGLVLRLDQACKNQLESGLPPILMPKLPRILLGFSPTEPPCFEDSPALRRLAARKLGMPVNRLGSNGQVLLDRLLQDLWHRQLVARDAPGNSTDKLLVDAEFCTQARWALEIYEDFSELVGMHVWNPVRKIKLLETENPAREVLRLHDVDTTQNFSQCFSHELIARLETAMRAALGGSQRLFTQEEILDGLTSPDRPLVGYRASLPKLRSQISPYVSECTTDDDLLRAARHPDEPLIATGACRIQVVSRGAHFGHDGFTLSTARRQTRIQACVGMETAALVACHS